MRIGILRFFFLKSIKKERRAIEEELKGKMLIFTAKSSSVDTAGGGGGGGVGPPLAAEYAKDPVFITFQTNFCSKSKNNPPTGIGNKNVTALTLD